MNLIDKINKKSAAKSGTFLFDGQHQLGPEIIVEG